MRQFQPNSLKAGNSRSHEEINNKKARLRLLCRTFSYIGKRPFLTKKRELYWCSSSPLFDNVENILNRSEHIAQKEHNTMNTIYPLQDLDLHQTLCPYHPVKTDLCLAALASLMIDKQGCYTEKHKDCAIFFVNNKEKGKHRKVLTLTRNTSG